MQVLSIQQKWGPTQMHRNAQKCTEMHTPNSTECQICEDVIQSLDTVLTDPSDQKEILDDLSSVVCTPLGPFKDDCPVDLAGSLSFAGGGGGI